MEVEARLVLCLGDVFPSRVFPLVAPDKADFPCAVV